MENAANYNWEQVYQSLNIDASRKMDRWTFLILLIIGGIPVVAAFLFLKHMPIIVMVLLLALIVVSAIQAIKLYLLSGNPRVYSGFIVGLKPESHTGALFNKGNYVNVEVNSQHEIKSHGKVAIQQTGQSVIKKFKCPSVLFKQLFEGQEITLVVHPHEKYIIKIL